MKKIPYKKYKWYKIILVILLAIIMGGFVALGNFIIPLIVFFIAVVLMFFLKKNVDSVLTDERVEKASGKASRIVMVTSAMLMAVAGIILVASREISPIYLLIGNILLYTECGMMLLYSILFKIFSKRKL